MTLSTAPAPEGAPEPASVTFSDFGLHPDVLKAVTAAGYTKPTPIQAKAIPVVMAGHDVMAAAQTGTGKTAGFALPIINALMPSASHSASPARHPVRALIIAPTRELADQIHDNVKTYIQFTPLRSAAVFGGVDMQPQTNALRAGVEILIATPGRLLDHVQQKSVNLSQVQLLVLDEADRMLDMGFLPDIQRIINLLSPRRQNLMFSATFSDEIRKLAKRFLNEPKLIEVARPNTLAENVEQTVYHVPSEDLKRDAVGALIRERGIEQVIVFSNTKIGADTPDPATPPAATPPAASPSATPATPGAGGASDTVTPTDATTTTTGTPAGAAAPAADAAADSANSSATTTTTASPAAAPAASPAAGAGAAAGSSTSPRSLATKSLTDTDQDHSTDTSNTSQKSLTLDDLTNSSTEESLSSAPAATPTPTAPPPAPVSTTATVDSLVGTQPWDHHPTV